MSSIVALPLSHRGLNWRGKLIWTLATISGYFRFPDVRAEWNKAAAHRLRVLINEGAPDVVIMSHEPASVLELAGIATSAGVPWIADLGDPICAPYIPLRWRRRARRLEQDVCRTAALVVVTTTAYARYLNEQHGIEPSRCLVISQGFDPSRPAESAADVIFEPGLLEILFAGQLYWFRRPEPIFSALEGLEGIRLTIISRAIDPAVEQARSRLGSKLRLIGPLEHEQSLALQAKADVLLNIGNRLPLQMPGKLIEYLGMCKPVLHMHAGSFDEGAALIERLRRGWVIGPDFGEIRLLLSDLVERYARGELDRGLDLTREAVQKYSWPALAENLSRRLEQVVTDTNGRTQ